MADFKKIRKIDELYDIRGDKEHTVDAERTVADRTAPTDNQERSILAGDGKIGGGSAFLNDQARFLDWINGSRGKAGRDFTYMMSCMGLANPYAAGAILAAMGTASAVHAIATSSMVRYVKAKRALNTFHRGAMSEKGYRPGVKLFGRIPMTRSHGVAYGANPFKSDIDKELKLLVSNMYDSSDTLLNKNGGIQDGPSLAHDAEFYQQMVIVSRMQEISRTVVGTLYRPRSTDSVIENNMQALLSSIAKADGKSHVNVQELKGLAKELDELKKGGSTAPLIIRMQKEIDTIRRMGEDECENYKKLQSYSLKHAKANSIHRYNDLKAIWEKYMKEIDDSYRKKLYDIVKSENYSLVAAGTDVLVNVDKKITSLDSDRKTAEIGDLWVGTPSNANGRGPLTFVVSDNQSLRCGGDEIELTLVNSDIKGTGNPIKRLCKFTDLYFGKTNPKMQLFRSNGTQKNIVPNGKGNYYMISSQFGSNIYDGFDALTPGGAGPDSYLYVQAYKGTADSTGSAQVVNAAGLSSVPNEVVWYTILNYAYANLSPIMFWTTVGHFEASIIRSGYTQVNMHMVEKDNQSVNVPYANPINEDEDDHYHIDIDDDYDGDDDESRSEGSYDKDSTTTDLSIGDNELKAKLPSAYYYLPGSKKIVFAMSSKTDDDILYKVRVLFTTEEDTSSDGTIKTTEKFEKNKEHFDFESMSLKDWTSMSPIQIALNLDITTKAPDGGGDDGGDGGGEDDGPTKGWPVSYEDMASHYMTLDADECYPMLDGTSFVEMCKDYGLKKYKLVYDEAGKIIGVTDDPSYPGPSLSDYDVLKKYVMFLGEKTLFKDEDDYTTTLADNAEKYIHKPEESSQSSDSGHEEQNESVTFNIIKNALFEAGDNNATVDKRKVTVKNGTEQKSSIKGDDYSVKNSAEIGRTTVGDGSVINQTNNYFINAVEKAQKVLIGEGEGEGGETFPKVTPPKLVSGVIPGVRVVCSVIKAYLDAGFKALGRKVTEILIRSFKSGQAYGFEPEDLKSVIESVKDSTSATELQPNSNPNDKYVPISEPNKYTVVEFVEVSGEGEGKLYKIRYAVPTEGESSRVEERVITGDDWQSNIKGIIVNATSRSIENNEVLEEEIADIGIMAGYTYTISKSVFDSLTGKTVPSSNESLFDRYYNSLYNRYRGIAVNEAEENGNVEGSVPDYIVLKCTKVDTSKSPGVVSFLLFDGKDTAINLSISEIDKSNKENSVGSVFKPYRVNLEEGKTYRLKENAKRSFEQLFGMAAADSAHVYVNSNMPNDSLVSFTVYQNDSQGEGVKKDVDYYKLHNEDFEEVVPEKEKEVYDSELEVEQDYETTKKELLAITDGGVAALATLKDNDEFTFRVVRMSDDRSTTSIMIWSGDEYIKNNEHFVKDIDTKKLEEISTPVDKTNLGSGEGEVKSFGSVYNTNGYYASEEDVAKLREYVETISQNAGNLAKFYSIKDADVRLEAGSSQYPPSVRNETLVNVFGGDNGMMTENAIKNQVVAFGQLITNTSNGLKGPKKRQGSLFKHKYTVRYSVNNKSLKTTVTLDHVSNNNGEVVYTFVDEQGRVLTMTSAESNLYIFVPIEQEQSSLNLRTAEDITPVGESALVYTSPTLMMMTKLYNMPINEAIVINSDNPIIKKGDIGHIIRQIRLIVENDMLWVKQYISKNSGVVQIGKSVNNQNWNSDVQQSGFDMSVSNNNGGNSLPQSRATGQKALGSSENK